MFSYMSGGCEKKPAGKKIIYRAAVLLSALVLSAGAMACERNGAGVSDNSAVSGNAVSENVTLNLPAPVQYSELYFTVPEGFTESSGNTEESRVYKAPMSADDSYIAYTAGEKDPGDDYDIMTKEDIQAELNQDVDKNAAVTDFANEDLGDGVRRIKTRVVYRKDEKDYNMVMYIYVTDKKVFTLIYVAELGSKWAADYEQSQKEIQLVAE